MDSELATVTDFPGEWSLVGWQPPPGLPFEQWHDIGQALGTLHKSLRWLIGDWLNYGETNYGEKYSQAVHAELFSYQDLRNIASVAARVPLSHRCYELSWTHHRHVACLSHDEQRHWLARARDERLTTSQLKKELDSTNSLPVPDLIPEPPAPEPLTTPADYRAARVELDAGAPKPQRKAELRALVETWENASEAAQEQADDVTDLTTCPNCGHSWSAD